MKINIASNEVIHFIGIGGIGMSGLAQIMTNMDFQIQGSDLNSNKNTDRLIKAGVKIYIGHNSKNIKKATMVVVSSAIKKNNIELIASNPYVKKLLVLHLYNKDFKLSLSKQISDFPKDGVFSINERKLFFSLLKLR